MEKLEAKTQKEEVLMYLKKYGKISTIEASSKLFIADLQSVIRCLRKKMDIGDEWVYKKNKFGRPCHFKRYFIEDKRSFWERLRFFI